MTYGAGGAAAAAAIAQAIKASGVFVRVTPQDFQSITSGSADGIVVHAIGGVFKRHHKYLTSYKGLAFYTESDHELSFPGRMERVEARKIWIPA